MNHCEIVRDLLPLYIEDMASEGSGELIREHLAHCNSCDQAYQRMIVPTPPPTVQREEWKLALQKVRKAEKKQRRRKIFLWGMILLVILCIGASHLKDYMALHQEISHSKSPIAPEDILTLCPSVVPTEEELGFLTWGASIPILTDTSRSISEEEFAPYGDEILPPNARIGVIDGWKQILSVDYFFEEQRIMLCYRDENEDGSFDTLQKFVIPLPLDGSLYYCATYSARTVTTQYEVSESSS